MPVTVVPRSLATVAIAVFITVVSRAITNCPAPSVSRTVPVAPAPCFPVSVIVASLTVRALADRGSQLGHLVGLQVPTGALSFFDHGLLTSIALGPVALDEHHAISSPRSTPGLTVGPTQPKPRSGAHARRRVPTAHHPHRMTHHQPG